MDLRQDLQQPGDALLRARKKQPTIANVAIARGLAGRAARSSPNPERHDPDEEEYETG